MKLPVLHRPRRKRVYSSLEKRYQQIQRDLNLGLAGLLGVIGIGTAWYTLVEGWGLTDALYMTVITLATVGFAEIHPLGDRGRLFTVSLIVLGVVVFAYIVNRFTDALVQGYLQEGRRLRQRRQLMDRLRHHYILCGFGRTGQQIAQEFAALAIPFVVVDSGQESLNLAQELGYIAVLGDATLDQTLMLVHVETAACLVTALPSDAENLYTTLSAKTLNPHIRVIARASNEEASQKLKRVGADMVVSPYITGGKRMAAAALRPQVMDFMDGLLSAGDRTYYMEEVRLDASICPVIGKSLRDSQLRSRTGVLILAIHRTNDELIAGPTADTRLLDGDLLIGMGTAEQLEQFNQILCPLRGDR